MAAKCVPVNRSEKIKPGGLRLLPVQWDWLWYALSTCLRTPVRSQFPGLPSSLLWWNFPEGQSNRVLHFLDFCCEPTYKPGKGNHSTLWNSYQEPWRPYTMSPGIIWAPSVQWPSHEQQPHHGSLCMTDVPPSDLGSRSRVHMHRGPQDAEHTSRAYTARRGLRGITVCGFGWPQTASQRLLRVQRSATGQAVLFRRHQPRDGKDTWNPAKILTNHIWRGWQKLLWPVAQGKLQGRSRVSQWSVKWR